MQAVQLLLRLTKAAKRFPVQQVVVKRSKTCAAVTNLQSCVELFALPKLVTGLAPHETLRRNYAWILYHGSKGEVQSARKLQRPKKVPQLKSEQAADSAGRIWSVERARTEESRV